MFEVQLPCTCKLHCRYKLTLLLPLPGVLLYRINFVLYFFIKVRNYLVSKSEYEFVIMLNDNLVADDPFPFRSSYRVSL